MSRLRKSMLLMAVATAVAIPCRAVAMPKEACALLTPAQVSTALGVSVKAGERIVPSSATLCGFGSADMRKRVVTAIITPKMFAYEKHPMQGITEEQVPGMGDEAHFMTTPGFGTGLSVTKSGFAFKVRVYGFPVDQVKAKEKMLAEEILAKL